MRFSKEHLTFKALVALDEAAASVGPVHKSFALRFALAYLYASTGGERWLFDDFWRTAVSPPGVDYMSALARRQTLEACMNGICRAARMDRTPDLICKLRDARGGDGKRSI
jgi:hypothetical protein